MKQPWSKRRSDPVEGLVYGAQRIEPNQFEMLSDGAKTMKASKGSQCADLFDFHLRVHKLTGWVREHAFALDLGRKWRFDFAHIELKLAVEIEGLVVRRIGGQLVCMGRHANIAGFKADCDKYNTANEFGWHVFRFEQSQVKNGEAIARIENVLSRRGWKR